jgi:hypothetical protein
MLMDGETPPNKNPINDQPHEEQVSSNAAPESTADYANYQKPGKPKLVKTPSIKTPNVNFKKFFKIILTVAIIAALAAAAYLVFFKSKPAKAPTRSGKSSNTLQSGSNSTATPTKHYDSSNFNLGFDYPEDWKVSDVDGSGKLTVTSPAMKLKDASGQNVTGQIIMEIRDKTQKLTEFDKGSATAARDSEKIAYTKPSQTQRASTYISFLSYATSTTSGGFNGIYITGDNGYQKGQDIPLVDITKVDPTINITFNKCADDKCSVKGAPMSVSLTSWSDINFANPLKSMLESLSIT